MDLGTPESSISLETKIRFGSLKLNNLSIDIEERQYDEDRIFRELIPLNFELPINKDFNIDEIFHEIDNNENNIKTNDRPIQNDKNNSIKGSNKKPNKSYSKKMDKDNLEDIEENFYPFKEESFCFLD